MRAHEIDDKGKASIRAAIDGMRLQMASGTSRAGYTKSLTMSRWMFYVLENGNQTFETTDLDDAITRYNEL